MYILVKSLGHNHIIRFFYLWQVSKTKFDNNFLLPIYNYTNLKIVVPDNAFTQTIRDD